MKRGGVVLGAVLIAGLALSGCGDFQERAREVQSRLVEAEERARIAEEAAARNTGRLIELEERVSEVEARLQDASQHDVDAPE